MILLDSHSESDLDSSASEQQLEETVVTNADNIMVLLIVSIQETLVNRNTDKAKYRLRNTKFNSPTYTNACK